MKANTVKETGVSIEKQYSQEDIPGLLANLTAKISEIKKGLGDEVKTSGILQGFGKIKDITTVSGLVKAYASIAEREKAYDSAAEIILASSGIKKPALKIDGSTPAEWKADIEIRVISVGRKAELAKLEAAKKILEDNLSAADKLAKSLSDVAGLFTSEIE